MIRLLRYLFLPTAAFLIIAGLAWGEWAKVIQMKKAAEDFLMNSELRIFKDIGERPWQGKLLPTYEYELDGEVKEFPTYSRFDLPADGGVRMGLDPFPRFTSLFSEQPQREIVVPIDGPDTVETVYKGMRGHEIGKDYTKASLVSVAAIVAGIAGFFLQSIIFRDVGRAFRAR